MEMDWELSSPSSTGMRALYPWPWGCWVVTRRPWAWGKKTLEGFSQCLGSTFNHRSFRNRPCYDANYTCKTDAFDVWGVGGSLCLPNSPPEGVLLVLPGGWHPKRQAGKTLLLATRPSWPHQVFGSDWGPGIACHPQRWVKVIRGGQDHHIQLCIWDHT